MILVLVLASLAFAQQHAPTTDVCRADVRLWSDLSHSKAAIEKLTVSEMTARTVEMGSCYSVDPTFGVDMSWPRDVRESASPYMRVADFYVYRVQEREMNFLDRHNMYKEFLQEDEDGRR